MNKKVLLFIAAFVLLITFQSVNTQAAEPTLEERVAALEDEVGVLRQLASNHVITFDEMYNSQPVFGQSDHYVLYLTEVDMYFLYIQPMEDMHVAIRNADGVTLVQKEVTDNTYLNFIGRPGVYVIAITPLYEGDLEYSFFVTDVYLNNYRQYTME